VDTPKTEKKKSVLFQDDSATVITPVKRSRSPPRNDMQKTPVEQRTQGMEDPFTGPRLKSPKMTNMDSPSKMGTPLISPSAMRTLSLSSPSTKDVSLTTEVTVLLTKNNVKLADAVQEELNEVLRRHNAKLQGVIKGRDFARTALKKKDETIEQLTKKTEELESGLDMHRQSSALLMQKLRDLQSQQK
jgi:hypothetical protein